MDFGKGWNSRDSALLVAALAATYADTETTKELLKRGGEETNPLLGRHPSGSDLDKSAIASGAILAALAGVVPSRERKTMLGVWTGFRAGLAYKNARTNPKSEPTDFLHSGLEGPLSMAVLGGLLSYILSIPEDVQVGATLDKEGPKLSFKKDF